MPDINRWFADLSDADLTFAAAVACAMGCATACAIAVRAFDGAASPRYGAVRIAAFGGIFAVCIVATSLLACLAVVPSLLDTSGGARSLAALLVACLGGAAALAFAADGGWRGGVRAGLLLGGTIAVAPIVTLATYNLAGVTAIQSARLLAALLLGPALTTAAIVRLRGGARRQGQVLLILAICATDTLAMASVTVRPETNAPDGMIFGALAVMMFTVSIGAMVAIDSLTGRRRGAMRPSRAEMRGRNAVRPPAAAWDARRRPARARDWQQCRRYLRLAETLVRREGAPGPGARRSRHAQGGRIAPDTDVQCRLDTPN